MANIHATNRIVSRRFPLGQWTDRRFASHAIELVCKEWARSSCSQGRSQGTSGNMSKQNRIPFGDDKKGKSKDKRKKAARGSLVCLTFCFHCRKLGGIVCGFFPSNFPFSYVQVVGFSNSSRA